MKLLKNLSCGGVGQRIALTKHCRPAITSEMDLVSSSDGEKMDEIERRAIVDAISELEAKRASLSGAANKKARKRVNKKLENLRRRLEGKSTALADNGSSAATKTSDNDDDDWACMREQQELNAAEARTEAEPFGASATDGTELRWNPAKGCYDRAEPDSAGMDFAADSSSMHAARTSTGLEQVAHGYNALLSEMESFQPPSFARPPP
jgi:ElaB/YqjD/DUF883 family membrane-anchored ribosome-binding protein